MVAKAKYIRDGRAPVPKDPRTSEIMSRIRAKNTKPEIFLQKALKRIKLGKFKKHYKDIPGRPDICFPQKKVAIFVNGCYWHRCPYCKPSMPKTHKAFWINKFKNNVARDKKKIKELKKLGWLALTFWECQIRKDVYKYAKKLKIYLKQTK